MGRPLLTAVVMALVLAGCGEDGSDREARGEPLSGVIRPAASTADRSGDARAGGPARLLVGAWHAETAEGASPITMELVMNQNGSYSWTAVSGALLVWHNGTWKADEARGTIRYTIADYEPRTWCDGNGCRPVTFPPFIDERYEVEQNRLVLTGTTGCPAGGCGPVTFTRYGT